MKCKEMVCTGSNYGVVQNDMFCLDTKMKEKKKKNYEKAVSIRTLWKLNSLFFLFIYSIFHIHAVVILGDGILQVHEIACESI